MLVICLFGGQDVKSETKADFKGLWINHMMYVNMLYTHKVTLFYHLLLSISCRLTKEKVSYEKEAVNIEERVEKMKADKKDEYEIKKMVS